MSGYRRFNLPHGCLEFNNDDSEITVFNLDGEIMGSYMRNDGNNSFQNNDFNNGFQNNDFNNGFQNNFPKRSFSPNNFPNDCYRPNIIISALIEAINNVSIAANYTSFALYYDGSELSESLRFVKIADERLKLAFEQLDHIDKNSRIINTANLESELNLDSTSINEAKTSIAAIVEALRSGNASEITMAKADLATLASDIAAVQAGLSLSNILA
jgi:hypothetical protein